MFIYFLSLVLINQSKDNTQVVISQKPNQKFPPIHTNGDLLDTQLLSHNLIFLFCPENHTLVPSLKMHLKSLVSSQEPLDYPHLIYLKIFKSQICLPLLVLCIGLHDLSSTILARITVSASHLSYKSYSISAQISLLKVTIK